MTVSFGGSRFGSCSGRAVSIRCDDAAADPSNVMRETGRNGATILVVSPRCWSRPGLAIALAAGHGFQVVISGTFNTIVFNNLISAAILPVSLDSETIAKVADAVESDPEIVLTVDLNRGDVRAGDELLALFDIHTAPDEWAAEPSGEGDMAGRLLMAQRLLGSARLPSDVRMRLQRRLVAICDAMKAPGADDVRGARRLDLLLAELTGTGRPGPEQTQRSALQTPRRTPRIPLSRSIESGSGVDTP
jgi:3-isopropylmalate dehydratase small subunit